MKALYESLVLASHAEMQGGLMALAWNGAQYALRM